MNNMKQYTEEEYQEMNDLIAILADQVDYLARFSADHDDLFDVQLEQLEQIIRDLRKQLL
jgi:hypothetical protein